MSLDFNDRSFDLWPTLMRNGHYGLPLDERLRNLAVTAEQNSVKASDAEYRRTVQLAMALFDTWMYHDVELSIRCLGRYADICAAIDATAQKFVNGEPMRADGTDSYGTYARTPEAIAECHKAAQDPNTLLGASIVRVKAHML